MYTFATSEHEVDAWVIENGCADAIFEVAGSNRVEVCLGSHRFDFMHELGKLVSDGFDGRRVWFVFLDGAE